MGAHDTPQHPSDEHPRVPAWTLDAEALEIPSIESIGDITRDWAWSGATGKGIRVAIVDSGIDPDHPALQGCVDEQDGVEIVTDIAGTATEQPGPHRDSFGHGTACASIIHGVAPEARITSVKVLGETLHASAAAFVQGLKWAIGRGFDVISLSLGTAKKNWALPFYELCDDAYFRGCFVATAADNEPRKSYPSFFASVASVACNLDDEALEFQYNPHPPAEFQARGVNVPVAWRDGGTMTVTGNSYAAPHIAGIAALILSKHPEVRPFQLKTVLWATSTNVEEAMRSGLMHPAQRGAGPV